MRNTKPRRLLACEEDKEIPGNSLFELPIPELEVVNFGFKESGRCYFGWKWKWEFLKKVESKKDCRRKTLYTAQPKVFSIVSTVHGPTARTVIAAMQKKVKRS